MHECENENFDQRVLGDEDINDGEISEDTDNGDDCNEMWKLANNLRRHEPSENKAQISPSASIETHLSIYSRGFGDNGDSQTSDDDDDDDDGDGDGDYAVSGHLERPLVSLASRSSVDADVFENFSLTTGGKQKQELLPDSPPLRCNSYSKFTDDEFATGTVQYACFLALKNLLDGKSKQIFHAPFHASLSFIFFCPISFPFGILKELTWTMELSKYHYWLMTMTSSVLLCQFFVVSIAALLSFRVVPIEGPQCSRMPVILLPHLPFRQQLVHEAIWTC